MKVRPVDAYFRPCKCGLHAQDYASHYLAVQALEVQRKRLPEINLGYIHAVPRITS